MKITFIITRADDLGGAQVHVRDLAAALSERGEDVTVLAGGGGVLFEALAGSAVDCRKLDRLTHPIRPRQDWAAYKEIRAALQDLKPDLVTTHSNKAGLLGRFAARMFNIPVVHTSHGFLFSTRPNSPAGRFYRLMEGAAARAASRVIAVSESEFEAAQSLRVIASEKMAVVHNGLPDLEPPLAATPSADPPRLVMVARFAEPKDHLTLIKALGGLKEQSWSLVLVGDGSGRARAERLAKQQGIANRVEFTGVRDDVPVIMASSQVFVLSSRREGFPLSVLEAMRAGLPVVASGVGGIGEAVAEGESGLLFPPGNVEALRVILGALIKNSALRESMGMAGRRRFLERFTLEQMVDKTMDVYRSVLS